MTALASSLHVVEAELIAYRRTWRGTVISTFVNPVFFLSAMGLGLGTLVDSGSVELGVPYITFVATGLMAANAMQVGASEGSFPVMAGIKWRKQFHATITTPVTPADIVLGRTVLEVLRLVFVLGVFTVIAAAFGALELRTALLAIPPAVLTGTAFTTVVTAYSTANAINHNDAQALTTLFRFGITPLFLFSGTFFPITNLPQVFQYVAYGTPLFHGVELVRKIALPGTGMVTTIPLWVHFVYLGVMTAIGLVLATRLLDKALRP
ncbi:MAG: ABC transporter permease [Actinobacteria bacterium]|nr:ABC transporter permease [Actinomycetota bacterium]MCI0679413.1 ABC transporter permease [Actinomycetota bacterium]